MYISSCIREDESANVIHVRGSVEVIEDKGHSAGSHNSYYREVFTTY